MKTNETTPIPQGYKATPLGIIPQEWEVKPLGEVGKLLSGLTYSPSNIRSNGLLVLRSSNIQEGQLVFEDNVFVDVLSYTPVKEGDILICVRNGSQNLIGKTAIITKKAEGCAFGAFMAIFRSPINQYIFYLFGTEIYRKYIYRNLGATINSINGSDLRRFRFPFPPLAEQKKIAEVLGVWDKAIEKQSQLIEQLTLRKRGLMQQLLTAKRRLPGFSEPWKELKIRDIAKIRKGEQVNKEDLFSNAKYPVINGGITPSGYLDIYNTTANTITISEGGNSCGYVNFMTTPFWSGGHCYTIDVKDGINNLFVYQLLKHNEKYIMSLRVGSGLPNIQVKDLGNLRLVVPNNQEQTAIAQVLTAADREIELAQQKLELLRQQKRGLMQQLLTGKKRVKV